MFMKSWGKEKKKALVQIQQSIKKILHCTCVRAIRMHKYKDKEVTQTPRSQHLCIETASTEGDLHKGHCDKADKYEKEVRLETR